MNRPGSSIRLFGRALRLQQHEPVELHAVPGERLRIRDIRRCDQRDTPARLRQPRDHRQQQCKLANARRHRIQLGQRADGPAAAREQAIERAETSRLALIRLQERLQPRPNLGKGWRCCGRGFSPD